MLLQDSQQVGIFRFVKMVVMREYTAIGFDLGGVLIQNSVHLFYQRTMDKFGVTMEQLAPVLEEVRKPLERGEITVEQFWQDIGRRFGKSYDPSMLSIWTDKFIEGTPAIPHMLELVDRLKSNGYKLGLLSNTTEPHVAINRTRGIFEHFDVALMSNEIGLRKPEKAAYLKLAKELKVEPSELVFIDDLEENVAGADAAGLTGVKFAGYQVLLEQLKDLNVRV